jgi:predicted Zn-dependent protease
MISVYPKGSGTMFRMVSIDGTNICDDLIEALKVHCIPLRAGDMVAGLIVGMSGPDALAELTRILCDLLPGEKAVG